MPKPTQSGRAKKSSPKKIRKKSAAPPSIKKTKPQDTIARQINEILFAGSPFRDFDASLYPNDPQGWFAHSDFIDQVIDRVQPRLIVEVGTWKGLSAIHMLRRALTHHKDASIVCVDTWLGSSEHWLHPKWKQMLGIRHGRPTLHEQFLANVVHANLDDWVTPLPLPSRLASIVLSGIKLMAPMIYLDGAHDEASVREDIAAWWPLVSPGGIVVGDDYGSDWPGVIAAVGSFWASSASSISQKGVHGNKWFAIKTRP